MKRELSIHGLEKEVEGVTVRMKCAMLVFILSVIISGSNPPIF
jgi:hypothetical protein